MRPGRAADHSPPSSTVVMEEYSYTSTHPLCHTGPVSGSLHLFSDVTCGGSSIQRDTHKCMNVISAMSKNTE